MKRSGSRLNIETLFQGMGISIINYDGNSYTSNILVYTGIKWRLRDDVIKWKLACCAGNSPVTGKRPVTRSFDVFFDLRLNKRMTKPHPHLYYTSTFLHLLLTQHLTFIFFYCARDNWRSLQTIEVVSTRKKKKKMTMLVIWDAIVPVMTSM